MLSQGLKNERVLSGEGLHALPKDRADKPSPATRPFFNIRSTNVANSPPL